jgi:hypothetical protein
MNYVQATTGGGGWPLNVFLTPALAPLFGGTYWPGPDSTSAHRDHVGFLDILRKMEQVWRAQRQRCRESASEIADQLREFAQEGLVSREGLASQNVEGGDVLELELLDEAYEYFASRFDESFGGFGSAPKFPTPVNLQFLLALGQYPQAVTDILDEKDVEKAKNMVVKTLEIMWKGGIKDQIGNGFSRYSVTRDWSLPHFEKMYVHPLSVFLISPSNGSPIQALRSSPTAPHLSRRISSHSISNSPPSSPRHRHLPNLTTASRPSRRLLLLGRRRLPLPARRRRKARRRLLRLDTPRANHAVGRPRRPTSRALLGHQRRRQRAARA